MKHFLRKASVFGIAAAAVLAASTAAYALLEHGKSGGGVRDLQQILKDKGFYKGKIDGKFGDGTESAVKAFQKEKGLTVDGIVGDDTWIKLKPDQAPEPTVRIGDTGDAVGKLQEFLKIKSDGKFGKGTKAALMKFQKKEGIRADGVAGPDTWSRLKS